MSAHVLRVLSASVDGRRLDIHRASLVARLDSRGRRTWELTGWMDSASPDDRSWLVADRHADVVIETSGGPISGAATVSLMAFADASGSRTMVRIWSVRPPDARAS